MVEKVIMPKLEMAQETGKVIEWLKSEGETVVEGEPLFMIETDKVTVEIQSPASGILRGIRVGAGEEVPISTVIAYILEPAEEQQDIETVFETVMEPLKEAAKEALIAQTALVSPVARRMAEALDVDLGTITGTGAKGQITKADVERAAQASQAESIGGKVRATPAARRLANERRIGLASVKGTGPQGRIQAEDIAAAKSPVPAVTERAAEIIPLEGIRKTIAERMTKSYQSIPHINFTVRVDMSGIETARRRLNNEAQEQGPLRVSITTFMVTAVAWALKRNPFINSILVGEEIHLLPDINIGVAVALENGIIVPVVHNADQKGLLEISDQVNDIVTRAHAGRLTPADVAGGTFTISNLGPFGIEQFTAIINPPQTAILALGSVQQEVLPDQQGQITIKPMMRMTLSTDHRVIDGAMAARFLKDLKDAIEISWLLQL